MTSYDGYEPPATTTRATARPSALISKGVWHVNAFIYDRVGICSGLSRTGGILIRMTFVIDGLLYGCALGMSQIRVAHDERHAVRVKSSIA